MLCTRLVYDFLTKERLCFIVPIRLSRQLEFEVQTEVLHRGGEGGRGEEWAVHLSFVVGRDGEEPRYGVVCREGDLHRFVATRGLRKGGEEIAL